MKLVIVESPAKAKTIAKYLGDGYSVTASKGHIRDLPIKEIGVDIEHNYQPVYEVKTDEQKETIKRLKQEVAKADYVYLATDPDREGEAISWHLQTVLNLDPNEKNRIMFNEISKKAVNEAIAKPDYVNMNLVNAQQARRVLDRLVGYKVSPVICKKIQNKLSAGRVQSAALRILVDREKEIQAFKPEEYWSLSGVFEKPNNKPTFKASLTEKNGKKFKIKNKQECDDALASIKNAKFVVSNVKKGVTQSKPLPPFTTSTMQQDAVNKLRMSSSQAMQIAQQLYEGFDIPGMGHVALVTYIRTDSVRVSTDAINAARSRIASVYGDKYVPATPNFYSTKKDAQDAHEAIRPINVDLTPDSLKDKLQPGQYKLYKLIYERFLASQAEKASYNSVSVSISANEYGFSASGRTLIFDGYTAIYGEYSAKKDKEDESENEKLPELFVGDELNLLDLANEQRFTKPPLRYTEASIIKAMEERGIGRPSTFATIMATLYKREYVGKDGKYLVPSNLGIQVTEYLQEYFKEIVDIDFTAEMEAKLDDVAEKGIVWYEVVDEFYKPLVDEIAVAMHSEKVHMQGEQSDEVCEKCGSPMVIKTGKYGKYLACSNYPACSNIRSLKQKTPPKETDIICDKCGAKMLERTGKYGKYLACSNYPKCKNIKSIDEEVAKCPKCGKPVYKRKSKRGTVFYGCSGYPDCDFVSWDVPTGKFCPKCGKHLVYKEVNGVKKIICSDKNCKYDGGEASES